jgi:hypothetical protein
MTRQVIRLDPLMRRAAGSQAGGPGHPGATEATDVASCRNCYGTGVVPRMERGPHLAFGPCRACRSRELFVFIGHTADGDWVAVRDLPGSWGRGRSPIDALLAMERQTDPAESVFGPRFALPLPTDAPPASRPKPSTAASTGGPASVCG